MIAINTGQFGDSFFKGAADSVAMEIGKENGSMPKGQREEWLKDLDMGNVAARVAAAIASVGPVTDPFDGATMPSLRALKPVA